MRVSLRRLLEARGFSAVCVLTLMLGIGGNTAVFTLIDRVVLKALPVPRPSELYRLGDANDCCVNSGLAPGAFSLFSYDLYLRLRDAAPQFTHLAAFQANTRAVTIGHADPNVVPETMNGAFVSGNYFQMLELVPAAGRLIQPSDDQRGAPAVAVISHRVWTERFASRSDLVGRPVTLNGVPATIVGVAPQGFYGETMRANPAEMWIPISNEPLLQPAARLVDSKQQHWLYAIGRLKPGVATAPIEQRLTSELRRWIDATLDLSAAERTQLPRQHITIVPAASGVSRMRSDVAPSLRLLQALAAAVLLIACANLANLLLARGTARRSEIAVRVALGASRARLVWESLIESLLLACAGGLAGLAVSFAGARAIINLAFRGATDIPVDPSPSLVVIGFACAASLATGALFGVAPALVSSRADPIDALRGAGRSTGERGSRVRATLIALQVALSLVLITCAGLLGRSLQKLESQDFGVKVEGRYVIALAPSLSTVAGEELPSLYARMRERLQQIPGIVNSAFSLYAPMSLDNWQSAITVDGHSTSERLSASWNRVSPGFFDTVGTPLLRGRAIDQRDGPGSPLVAVVTETFARTFFAGTDPIGRRLGFAASRGEGVPDIEIVGIVGDARYQDGRRAQRAMFFLAYLQRTADRQLSAAGAQYDRSHYPQALEIQTAGPVPDIERDVRRALADVDRRITVRSVVAMNEQVARAFNVERLIARLTIAFGLVALLLACLGLYGVTAYSVSRRTREIGLRIAVGATRTRVLETVLRGTFLQVAIGVAIGLPAAFGAGRLLQARLFGIGAHDPLVLTGGIALLALSALIAAILPARRAASMDPVRALRVE